MRNLKFSALVLGVFGILISLPFFGIAALGCLGILADIGPNENLQIGIQAFLSGLFPLICGLVLFAYGLLGRSRKNRGADAEPDAAADRREM